MRLADRIWSFRRAIFCLGALLGAIPLARPAATAIEGGSLAGYALPKAGFQFSFPRDHGNHPDFKIEWWYVTGHLFADQRRFGFQATFFRSALHPPPALDKATNYFGRDHVYLAHMALVDVAKGTYTSEEKLNRHGWDASAEVADLDVHNGNWRLRRRPAEEHPERMQLQASVLGQAILDLELIPQKPLVKFGHEGLSRKGADASAASYYLTFPRLRARGTLTLDGQVQNVQGEAWMDHEISSSQLSTNQVGWDWASLQLKDGREIMIYVMRTKSGATDPHSTLAWVDEGGRLVQVGPDKFSWRAVRHWRSPHTGGNYPVEIELQTTDPKDQRLITFRLRPLVADQELVGKLGGISYWEGACDVLDGPGRSIGSAYLELTGYAEDLSVKMGKGR